MGIVISIYSLKGGTGKTTLSVNLYDAFKRHNVNSIALVDADPQKSVYSLVDQLELLDINVLLPENMEEALEKDLVIIDTPPILESSLLDSLLIKSDLILIPCKPSAPDALSLLTSINKIKAIQKDHKHLKAHIVINGLITGNKFAGEVKTIIEGYGLPVLKTTIGQRLAFQKAIMSGSIYKEKNSKAVEEVEHLMNEVFRIVSL